MATQFPAGSSFSNLVTTASGGGSSTIGSYTSGGTSSSSKKKASIAPELNTLLQQLSGAVSDVKANQAARTSEIATNQSLRDQYSKDNAFQDASGLMTQSIDQAMEKALQSLTIASEGAGASQSSMRALLTQRAAEQAAIDAAALGANQAVNYGNISSSLSNVLEALTRPDDTTLQALVQAIGLKQGALNSAVTSSSSSSSGSKNTKASVSTKNNPLAYTLGSDPKQAVAVVGNVPYEPYPLTYGTTGAKTSYGGYTVGATATPQEVLNQRLSALGNSSALGQEELLNSIGNQPYTTGLAF